MCHCLTLVIIRQQYQANILRVLFQLPFPKTKVLSTFPFTFYARGKLLWQAVNMNLPFLPLFWASTLKCKWELNFWSVLWTEKRMAIKKRKRCSLNLQFYKISCHKIRRQTLLFECKIIFAIENTQYTNGEAISHQFIILLDPPKREYEKSWAKVGTIFKRGGGVPLSQPENPSKWYIFMKNSWKIKMLRIV